MRKHVRCSESMVLLSLGFEEGSCGRDEEEVRRGGEGSGGVSSACGVE